MKAEKSPREDNITADLLRAGGEQGSRTPDSWKTAIVTILH